MPLTPGKSKATFSKNISEFHKGPTYAHTAEKFGKARANDQAVAVAYSEKRRSGKGQAMPIATKKRTVGCGHASCGVGKGCSYKTGKGQAKKVGRGQGPPSAGGGMPPRKPKGAMPLPGAKVSRRHRPPMNKKPPGGGLGGPMDALKPPMPPMGGMPGGPGGMPPMGGGAPMGPAMLPGAGAGGTPGMPPPRPPMPGMGQARKKSKKKTPVKGKK